MKKKIIAFFKRFPGSAIKAIDLADKLSVKSEHEYEQLKFVLHQLCEEHFLERRGKRFSMLIESSNELTGTLHIVENGSYGFVVLPDDKIGDIFITAKNLDVAFNGDKVQVALFAKQRGKNLEGEIVKVVERKRVEIVGTLYKSKSFYFVQPDEKQFHRVIYISKENLNGADEGDKVIISNIEWRSPLLNPEAVVSKVLGKAGSTEQQILSLAMEFNLPTEFPDEVINECKKIPLNISDAEIALRMDLREKNIFTIDPDDAKDFDDAVSIENLENGNFLVGIHIADVSHYVKPGTSIYEEALSRGTSVYFVGHVIPMLPEILSNKICSLVPFEDRLTFSVFAELTPRCKIENYTITKSVINSKRRFTYKEAQDILNCGNGDFYNELCQINKLAKVLKTKRTKNGSINFKTSEVEFKLDENGKPIQILRKFLDESNNLIEELMLLANRIIGEHTKKAGNKDKTPFVYRIHDLPEKEKLNEFAKFVKSLGYQFDVRSANNSLQFQKLLESVEGTGEEPIINEVAIRSMAKAVYSTGNIGHYGLGFKYYTHFTSPIRRFPDLIAHLLIFDYIKNQKMKFSLKQLDYICESSSAQERNAVSAERMSIKLKQIEYLKSHVGDEFDGVISGVTNFGIFIQITENLTEGLIKLSDLDDDFYIFEEKQYSLTGRRTGKKYRLGDKVKVRVVRVDYEKRMVDFVLINNKKI